MSEVIKTCGNCGWFSEEDCSYKLPMCIEGGWTDKWMTSKNIASLNATDCECWKEDDRTIKTKAEPIDYGEEGFNNSDKSKGGE